MVVYCIQQQPVLACPKFPPSTCLLRQVLSCDTWTFVVSQQGNATGLHLHIADDAEVRRHWPPGS